MSEYILCMQVHMCVCLHIQCYLLSSVYLCVQFQLDDDGTGYNSSEEKERVALKKYKDFNESCGHLLDPSE